MNRQPLPFRTIVVVLLFVATGLELGIARADWQIYYTGSAKSMFGAAGRGTFATGDECRAYLYSRPAFEVKNSYCLGFDRPTYKPPPQRSPDIDDGVQGREPQAVDPMEAIRAQQELETRVREEREKEQLRQKQFAAERDALVRELQESGAKEDSLKPKAGTSFFGIDGSATAAFEIPSNDPMVVDLSALDLRKVPLASLLRCPPGIDKAIPTRQQLQRELADRRTELQRVRNNLIRISRELQLNQKEYAILEKDAQESLNRLRGQQEKAILDLVFNSYITGQKYFWADHSNPWLAVLGEPHNIRRDILRILKNAEGVYSTYLFGQWAFTDNKGALDWGKWTNSQKTDWKKIDDAYRLSMELAITPAMKPYFRMSQALIDNIYDVTDYAIARNNLQRLNRTSVQLSAFLKRDIQWITSIDERMKEIEIELRKAPTPPLHTPICTNGSATGTNQ